MKHNDEQTPIRERWTARPSDDDQAAAGALLRAAAQHGPVAERRLAEIHARLRKSRHQRAFYRPAPRLLRQIAFAAGFILCGGVLSASVMHVMRRPPKPPEIATPAPIVDSQKKSARRSPGKQTPVPMPSEIPETPAPAAPAALMMPAIPAQPGPSQTEVSTAASQPRRPEPHRRLAMRALPTPTAPSAPAALVPMATAVPMPAAPSPLPAPAAMPIPQAPVERPAPTMLPPPVLPAPQPPTPEPSRLARESRWLASAIAKLRQEGAPAQALAILDQHQDELGSGVLASEANAMRLEALLRLGRNTAALTLLDGQRLSAHGLEREMLVARAELRAEKGRAAAAVHDFDLILSSPGRADGITERALYGRAVCRARAGDREGARGDFAKYLTAFPQGRFAQDVRSALSQQLR